MNASVKPITCFKAYDLRGRIPDELNENVAYAVGRGYARFLSPKRVVAWAETSVCPAPPSPMRSVMGLIDSGVDVYDIGVCAAPRGCISRPSTAITTAASW